jgi:hypothetical protein
MTTKKATVHPFPSAWALGSGRGVLLEAPTGGPARTLAIDPGGTTGLAWIGQQRDPVKKWWVIETSDLLDIWRLLTIVKPERILFERFDPQELPVNLQALEVQGIVKLWVLQTSPATTIWWQSRDGAMNLCTDRFLRANALWVEGYEHGRDALRHLCWHLIKREHNTELLEWTRPST